MEMMLSRQACEACVDAFRRRRVRKRQEAIVMAVAVVVDEVGDTTAEHGRACRNTRTHCSRLGRVNECPTGLHARKRLDDGELREKRRPDRLRVGQAAIHGDKVMLCRTTVRMLIPFSQDAGTTSSRRASKIQAESRSRFRQRLASCFGSTVSCACQVATTAKATWRAATS